MSLRTMPPKNAPNSVVKKAISTPESMLVISSTMALLLPADDTRPFNPERDTVNPNMVPRMPRVIKTDDSEPIARNISSCLGVICLNIVIGRRQVVFFGEKGDGIRYLSCNCRLIGIVSCSFPE